MKLGGWQRLWILFSVIALIAVVFITWTAMPKARQYELNRYYATKKLIEKEATLLVEMPSGTEIRNVPNDMAKGKGKAKDLVRLWDNLKMAAPRVVGLESLEFYHLLVVDIEKSEAHILEQLETEPDVLEAVERLTASLEENAQRLQTNYGKWTDFTEVERQYKWNMKQLPSKRLKYTLAGLGSWLASIGIVYLFGWAIGWVIKGFKSRGET